MKNKIVLAVLVVSCSLTHAQQYAWRVMARLNTTGLYCLDFVDTLHGWCAGRDTIYRTTDGGATWRGSSRRFGSNSWHSISFSDTLHGWAVGRFGSDDGLLWKTTDGGVNWTEEQLIFNRYYWSNYSHSPNRNTISGYVDRLLDTALVVRTTNGGTSWQEQRFDTIGQLRKISFSDSLHGWITTGTSFILRTVDGGLTWQPFSTPFMFDALDFIDSSRGWAGISNTFFQTTNRGVSWQFQYQVPLLEDFGVEDISFVDSLNGWAFGSTAEPGPITEAIYRTTNGGRSWYRESVGLTSDLGILADGIMLDRFHGWAPSLDGRVLAYRPVTSIAEKLPGLPKNFALHQNYPNPFNPTTTIEYELSQHSSVRLTVHDVVGRLVETLVDQMQEAGIYRVQFNAAPLGSGTYFYTLETPLFKQTKQLLLIK